MEKEILDKLEHWTESLDKELQYDGIPLWVFYRQMFLINNFPNRFFNYSVKKLKERITAEKIENKKIVSYITRKAILMNESIKRKIRTKGIKNKNPKVLFYTQDDKVKEGKIRKIGNVVEEIKKIKDIDLFILSYNPIERIPKLSLKNQEHMIYEYITRDLIKKSKKEAKNLNKKWKNIPTEEKERLLKLKEVSLYKFLKEELNFLFSKEFLELVLLYHEAHKKLLLEENIKMVCATGAGTIYPKTLFSAAHTLGIPTLVVQHGMCFSYTEKDIFNGTKFTVFGEKSKEELIEAGIKENQIVITGPAIYDEIIKFLNTKEIENTIALMTSGFYMYGLIEEEVYFKYIQRYLKEMNELKVKVTIKLHPEEQKNIEKYKKIAKEYSVVKNITATDKKEELYQIIGESSIVINFGSSIALESVILNKPVITILNLHNSPVYDFDIVVKRLKESGVTLNIDKEESIKEAIERVSKNKKEIEQRREKFLEESCYKLDGQAAKRIARVIQSSINLKE